MPSFSVPSPLRQEDPQGGALNLTRFAGIGAVIVGLITAINPIWDEIFGGNTPH